MNQRQTYESETNIRIKDKHTNQRQTYESKTNIRIKDKHTNQRQTYESKTNSRSLFCISGEITAYLFRIRPQANSYATNDVPRRFCMQHSKCFSKNVLNRTLGRTLHTI